MSERCRHYLTSIRTTENGLRVKTCGECGTVVSRGFNFEAAGLPVPPYRMERDSNGAYSITSNQTGQRVLDGESYQVASNVLDALNSGKSDTTECGELAATILSR